MTNEEAESDPGSDRVGCPECGAAAAVLARFTGADVEYLQIRCTGSLTMLVTADQVRRPHLSSA